MGILSPLTGTLTPMGYLRGATASVGGIDANCLALIRPVYSGGSWAPGDASQYGRTVTNSGITITDGPWEDANGAMDDASLAAYAYVASSSVFSATSIRDVDLWMQINERPAYNRVVLRIGTPLGTEYPGLTIRYGPGGTDKIRYIATSRLSATTEYAATSGDYGYNDGAWRHIRVLCPGGTGQFRLFVDGSQVAATTSHTPNFGSAPYVLLGVEKTVTPWNWNSISKTAEIRVSSVVRWAGDFTPPTGPYTT